MKKNIITIIAALSALLAISCQKNDGDVDYGNSLIYIPQATVSGGIDNIYNVPAGGGEHTANYAVSDETVDIYMGVLLSGKAASQGFSVSVDIDSKATTMPASAFTVPSVVTVDAGQNSKTFNISVKKSFIKANSGSFDIALGLSNPTGYELSKNATNVVVAVDVDALKEIIR